MVWLFSLLRPARVAERGPGRKGCPTRDAEGSGRTTRGHGAGPWRANDLCKGWLIGNTRPRPVLDPLGFNHLLPARRASLLFQVAKAILAIDTLASCAQADVNARHVIFGFPAADTARHPCFLAHDVAPLLILESPASQHLKFSTIRRPLSLSPTVF